MANSEDDGFGLSLDEIEGGVLPAQPAAVDDKGFDALAAGEKLAKETVVLELHIRKPGFTKPIKPEAFIKKMEELEAQGGELTVEQRERLIALRAEVEDKQSSNKTDPGFLHISQDVIDRKEIADIVRHDDRFNMWLKARSAPCPMLASGLYLIPIAFTNEVDAAIFRFIKEQTTLIDKFAEKYAALQEDAKKRRWPFYEEADYPAFSIIRAKYRVEAGYRSFNVPAALERINREIYERESEKAKLEWANSAQEMRDAARIAFQQYVGHLSGQLGRDEKTGKRKMLYGSSITNLKEFLGVFLSGGNLTGDKELEDYALQARQLLEGVDPNEVKKNASMRDTLDSGFAKLKELTAKLVTVQQRTFVLEEDSQPE